MRLWGTKVSGGVRGVVFLLGGVSGDLGWGGGGVGGVWLFTPGDNLLCDRSHCVSVVRTGLARLLP